MIQAQRLMKRFGELTAVDGVSLDIAEGEAFGLLGPNGAGKTTMIRLLVGALPPDEGTVTVGGLPDPTRPEVKKQIGVAPQELALYDVLTAEENLAFFGRLYGLRGKPLRERVGWGLEFAGLTDRRRDAVQKYSGGMKRRLNLACALVHEPKVFFLDEPTVGVDPQSRNHIFTSIEKLRESGCTLIYTTHYMEEAQRLCDRVAVIDKGKLLAVDTVENLIKQHGGDARLEGIGAALAQWRWLTRAMARCKAIVVPSRATLEQIRSVHPGAVRMTEVIPHPAPYVDEMQHDHDGSLLFLGRLDRRKAVAKLLAGCAQCEGQIRLAGPHDPARKAELERLVSKLGLQERVEFAGEVDLAMRNFLYRKAGVVALVSQSEGFGFPVLEALGRGVPVMVGRDTGAAEIGGNAVLPVDPNKPDQIAAAWRTALETEHRAFVRTQGPARLLQFQPEKVAKAYKELWRRALAC